MSDDIDPERKFSNGAEWANSIDWDDASDGSDGGYDRHGSPINANAMKELVQLRMEKSRLRADLAAVTAERDRMREALRPVDDHEIIERVAEALFVFVEAKRGNSRDFRGQAEQVLAYAYPRIIAKYRLIDKILNLEVENKKMREALNPFAKKSFDCGGRHILEREYVPIKWLLDARVALEGVTEKRVRR